MKQSVCYWPFRSQTSVQGLAEAAKAIGLQALELVPEDAWQPVKDAGLEIAIVAGHDSLTDGLNKRENHDRIEQELKENIRKAAAYGIPGLIVFSGKRDGLPDDEGLRICAEGVTRVVADAEEYGINLCMELLNSKVNHPDYQCDRTAWGVELCKAVSSPRFLLLYDIYHMQIMEGDLIRTIQDHSQYIGHVHTAGNPGRHDLDDEQEIYYPAVMRALAASGYDGYIGHEFTPKGDWRQALQEAYNCCEVSP